MKRYFIPMIASAGLLSLPTSAQVFQDNFDTSLASGVNTDVNFESGGGRQSGGTITSNWTELSATGSGGFINVNGSFTGDNLLLRNNYNAAGARKSGVVLDHNFSALAGTQYTVSFDANMSITSGAATDRWLSFFMMDALPGSIDTAGPATGTSDLGVLLRDNGRATIWDDGAIDTNYTTNGTTGVTLASVFSVSIVFDETGVTNTAAVTIAGTLLDTFEYTTVGTDRYFGLFAQIGTAGGTTNGALFDSRFDNFTVVPEPSTYALLAGLLAFAAVAVRRRS